MKILCDTNIFIEYYKNNTQIIQALKEIGSNDIAVSVITKAELFCGARNKQELAVIERNLSFCYCYELDIEVSRVFAELIKTYTLSHGASIPDMLIAATAIVHDIPLFTLNIKDFRFIPAIQLYNLQ